MAALSDLYQPATSTPAPFIQANTALQSGLAEMGAGEQERRLRRDYTQRALPRLASAEAARGTFHSGGAQQRAAWMAEDTADTSSDIQSRLAMTLADLARGGVLAQLGVQV